MWTLIPKVTSACWVLVVFIRNNYGAIILVFSGPVGLDDSNKSGNLFNGREFSTSRNITFVNWS